MKSLFFRRQSGAGQRGGIPRIPLAATRRAEQVHACVQELVGVGVRARPVASTQSGSLPRHGRTHPGHREAAAGVSGARLEHG